MRPSSSLSALQREAAVVLFQDDHGTRVVAARLGVSRHAVAKLYHRWLLRGVGALIMKPTRRSFSFEFKLEVVRRFLNGEATAAELAREHDLSAPSLVKTWARKYRHDGEDALRPKPRGRPPGDPAPPGRELSEVEQLRRDNQRLAAENAYLKKLRALRAQRRP